MQPETEFIVHVKKWPAYTLGILVPIVLGLYSLSVGLVVSIGELSSPVLLTSFAVTVIAALASLMLLIKVTVQAFTMIRYPPRISGQGMRLWLFPTSEYVSLPWAQVTAACTFVKGLSRGLFVYVADPESLTRQNTSKAKRIRRAMRRSNGAPFVYAINSSPARLHEIDEAIRGFSGGRLMLQNW